MGSCEVGESAHLLNFFRHHCDSTPTSSRRHAWHGCGWPNSSVIAANSAWDNHVIVCMPPLYAFPADQQGGTHGILPGRAARSGGAGERPTRQGTGALIFS